MSYKPSQRIVFQPINNAKVFLMYKIIFFSYVYSFSPSPCLSELILQFNFLISYWAKNSKLIKIIFLKLLEINLNCVHLDLI